jgi:hypothetical protein
MNRRHRGNSFTISNRPRGQIRPFLRFVGLDIEVSSHQVRSFRSIKKLELTLGYVILSRLRPDRKAGWAGTLSSYLSDYS